MDNGPTDRSREVGGKAGVAYARRLNGGGALIADVGGKAASLDRLVATGAPVPTAVALTAKAYRLFMQESGLDGFVADLPVRVPPGDLVSDARRVEKAFVEAPFPSVLKTIAQEAFFTAVEGSSMRLVSVRSSATAEDLASASFAGQYKTSLNVGEADVEKAIRLCWASLWAPGVRAYRAAQGLEPIDIAMGVIIQRMVAADHSGVLFTSDPTGDRPGLLRVEAVEGLGEGLVSGAVTPELYWVDRSNLTADRDDAPPFLPVLAAKAMQIEEDFGASQDIEWSVASGNVYILQARPITTTSLAGDGFDTIVDPRATFTSAGLGEMLPGVLPPLLWTINSTMLEEAFGSLYAALGVRLDDQGQPMVGRFRGRAALNLGKLKQAAAQMPGGSAAEVERQYLGQVVTENEHQESRKPGVTERLSRMRPAWHALRLRKRLLVDSEVFLHATRLAVGLAPDYREIPTVSLLAYRARVRDLAVFGVKTEVAVAAAAAANYRGLEIALERWVGEQEASLAAQRLTTGGIGGEGTGCAAVLALWDMHCEHCQLPHVAKAVYEGPARQVERRLVDVGGDGQEFLSMVRAALRRAGSTALYAGDTWEDATDAFWSALRRCSALQPGQGPPSKMAGAAEGAAAYFKALLDRVTKTRKWRFTRVMTGQIIDIRRRLLERMVGDATTFLRMRESVKSAMLRVGGEERRVIRELSRRLVEQGVLAHEGDEFYLSDEELEALSAGKSGPQQAVLEQRRRVFEAWKQAPPLPEVFTGTPGDPEPEAAPSGRVLSGWATSPGRVTARARVVRDLEDAGDLQPGEVLVGRSTDPSWTPLFLSAAAIVMEEGGPLSHAAIIAREFSLPAVLKARGATSRITTGMFVVVDGTAGTVELLDEFAEVAA
ncbi:MAG: PEP/pyruvate-binding domain-containing protein [Actinomycetota bacterium]